LLAKTAAYGRHFFIHGYEHCQFNAAVHRRENEQVDPGEQEIARAGSPAGSVATGHQLPHSTFQFTAMR
jgi:hypothetical protein